MIAAVAGLDPIFAEQTRPQPQHTTWAATDDVAWWESRIDDTMRRWGCTDRRAAGTLWWYSASHTLCAMVVAPLIVAGETLLVASDMPIWLRPNGYLAGCRPDRAGDASTGLDALRDLAGSAITALANASGAAERALWAIAADSLAVRALAVGEACNRVPYASSLAAELVADLRTDGTALRVRFVDVTRLAVRDAAATDAVPPGARRRVRRSSCCLIYQVPGSAKCVTCPRQRPDLRAERLRGLAD